jgi:outer membrane protein TolC
MMKLTVWGLVGALTGIVPLSAQQAPVQAPTTPQTAPQGNVAPGSTMNQYVVGQAKPPETGAPRLDLTMDDVINLALEHNLDLQVAKLNPQIQDYSLQQARAVYRPTMTSQFGYNNAQSQSTSTIEGGTVISSTTQTYNAGATQLLPWGENFTFSFGNTRSYTSASTSSFNPSLRASMSFNVTQSLLQGRKMLDYTRQVTDLTLKALIADTIAQVRDAYWDLRSSIEQIEITKQTLALAQKLVEDNNAKVTVGTLAPLDVLSAQSAVAQQQVTLANNVSTWQTRELALKRLIVGGTDDDVYKATINPVDRLDVTKVTPDIPGAITTALGQRTDLVSAKLNLSKTELNLRLLEDQVKPSLNLTGGYSLSGVGGPQLSRTSITGTVTDTIPGGYLDALGRLQQNPTWNVNFNLSYPLGQVAARASLASNRLSFEQAKTQIKVTEFTISTAVTNAALAVQNGYIALQASSVSRDLAERTAAAEQSKFEVGLSTNYNVVQALNDLNSARLSELNQMISYIKALIEYERVQAVG